MSLPVVRAYFRKEWAAKALMLIRRNSDAEFNFHGQSHSTIQRGYAEYAFGVYPTAQALEIYACFTIRDVVFQTRSDALYPDLGSYPLIDGVETAVVSEGTRDDSTRLSRVIFIAGSKLHAVFETYNVIRSGGRPQYSWMKRNPPPGTLIRLKLGVDNVVAEIESSVIPVPGSRISPHGSLRPEFKIAEEPPVYIYEGGWTIIEIQVAPVPRHSN